MAEKECVAQEIEKARVTDEDVDGMKVHDVLKAEEMSLQAYLAATKGSMWTSHVELELAARILSTPILYMSGKVYMQVENGVPRQVVRRVETHYVLVTLHRAYSKRCYVNECQRGGMQAWTWEGPCMIGHKAWLCT